MKKVKFFTPARWRGSPAGPPAAADRSPCRPGRAASALAGFAIAATIQAGVPAINLDDVVVAARRIELIGEVASASQGTVLEDEIELRPLLRPGELLEAVPGLVVTQHSGDGKANQYFLRGFNLDHGTDFATRVDGVPVNQPTHAHGQGYTDLNFLIPELVDRIEYRKGTYYAEDGDFSAAGAADVHYRRRLDAPLLTLSAGQGRFERAVAAASAAVAGGTLLGAAEFFHNDGPWDLPEGYQKLAALLAFSRGDAERGYGVEAQGYGSHWRATDQIPQRAVSTGLIDRFGAIDPTDRGQTHRYSLSGDWRAPLAGGQLTGSAYGIDSALDLVSNFTYATDPLHGDQFEQVDARHVFGGALAYTRPVALAGRPVDVAGGLQARLDDIHPLGLYRTQDAVRYATVREDRVRETGVGAYLTGRIRWTPWLRSDVGARVDRYDFRVASSRAANSGAAAASIASPKLALAFGPWRRTEYFLNVGRGFHSNDARGTTARVAPTDGVTPVAPVSPLVRAVGAEAGVRSAIVPRVQFAASWWTLQLDSELVFSGDGGTTAPSRASRRSGVEFATTYAPFDGLVVDADVAWTRARFTDPSPLGDRIPNALERVASVAVTVNREHGWYGGLRLRYFGPAPLVEDNAVQSGSTLLVNASAGYRVSTSITVMATVFNLFDRRDHDISYYYASQLRTEAAPVNDVHFHPVEPRTLRVSATRRF